MSMYAKLLAAALADRRPIETDEDRELLLAEVLWRRTLLDSRTTTTATAPSATNALADELAYDISLITLARAVGISCDADDFERPMQQRQSLEDTLAQRGIQMTDSEDSAQYST